MFDILLHPILQSANAAFFLSYLFTDLLALHIILTIGATLFVMAGVFVYPYSVDTILWNGSFAIINLYRSGRIMYSMRPMELEPMLELVYENMFKVNFTRYEFKVLTDTIASVKIVKEKENYVVEGQKPTNLSILIAGKLIVTKKYNVENETDVHISTISHFQFIDSPQYILRSKKPNQLYEVSITAECESLYLTWNIDDLDRLFILSPIGKKLERLLGSLCGNDVTLKLLMFDEAVAQSTSDEIVSSSDIRDINIDELRAMSKEEIINKIINLQMEQEKTSDNYGSSGLPINKFEKIGIYPPSVDYKPF